jgi:hypothetical protein
MSFPSACIFPSTPFALKHVEALDIETLLSSQGSRIVNVEKSSIVCSFLIPGGIPTWSTSTDLEWGFSVHEHRFPNLMLMAVVLFGSVKLTINELSSYIFYLSILWTSLWMCVFNENSIFQMVRPTHNTPNGFGVSSSNDPPPPPSLTPTEALLTTQTVTPGFPKKTKCLTICMPGSSFIHIVTS